MRITADLQLHSRFARAVSKEMTLPNMAAWAMRKGIGLLATGDWTHPLWFKEIEDQLTERGDGLLALKDAPPSSPLFLLATEVSCIYSQNGKGRRIHTLIWVPTLESARKINQQMTRQGCNLMSDGRPIIGLTSVQVADLVFSIEPEALIIPAHSWTPWFSVYGAMSGFDSLDEAFGKYAQQIYAVETGLSSNPSMNWQIAELDGRQIVSFSDAHSGPKMGREATVFELEKLTYKHMYDAIARPDKKNFIAYTIEFYPEEGKYHYSGHRNCNVRLTPDESRGKGSTCPVCGRPLTQGVMQRVEELAARTENELKLRNVNRHADFGFAEEVRIVGSEAYPDRPPFVMVVPLIEIIAESLEKPVTSPRVQSLYTQLTDQIGTEFSILLERNVSETIKIVGDRVAAGIQKVRKGDIYIDPGYDGVFGVVKLWKEGEEKPLVDASREQLSIF